MQDNSTVRVPTGEHSRLQRCDDDGYQQVVIVSGGGSGGTADTQETTQLLVKTAVEAINTATGPVSATPTANTILARLKDILTGIVLAAGTNIIGKAGIDQTTPGTTDSVTVKAADGVGALTETAPATDTASSGLNGRLQRVAQRLTSLIALLPTALTTAGNLKNSIQEFITTVAILQNAVSATGNGSTLDVSGNSVAVLQVSGTFVGTVYFEASNDDSTWYSINATQIGADMLVQSTTAAGLYRLSVAGIKSIRARVVWTSGTSVTVSGRATTADSHAKVVSPINTGHRAQVTITRTADTTAYAIGDAVGLTSAIYETTVLGKANGEFIVTAAHLHLAVATIPSGMTAGFNLHCFSSTPTAIADNAVIGTTLTTSDLLKRSAKIPIPLPVDEGNYCSIYNDGLNLQVTLSATGTLFVILETLSAFTPTSGAVKYLDIHGTEI